MINKTKLIMEHPKNTMTKCNTGSCLETDWCQADAMRESLREHMALLKDAQERLARINEIIVGDRKVYSQDGELYAEGTTLTASKWDELINERGLADRWCQIIIRPIEGDDFS